MFFEFSDDVFFKMILVQFSAFVIASYYDLLVMMVVSIERLREFEMKLFRQQLFSKQTFSSYNCQLSSMSFVWDNFVSRKKTKIGGYRKLIVCVFSLSKTGRDFDVEKVGDFEVKHNLTFLQPVKTYSRNKTASQSDNLNWNKWRADEVMPDIPINFETVSREIAKLSSNVSLTL